YTGWNLRDRSIGAESELLGLSGGYVPLARTAQQRTALGDPRRSLVERYGDFANYKRLCMQAAAALAKDRYILAEELPRLEAGIERFAPLFAPPAAAGK